MEKKFSITGKKKDSFGVFENVNIFFIILLLISFSVFLFYNTINGWLKEDKKIDIINNDLQEVAFYFGMIDRDLSNMMLTMDDIKSAYNSGDNVLKTKEDEIGDMVDYMKKNESYLSNVGFGDYETLIGLVSQAWEFKGEILELLGKDQEYNYLVILQNTNEKRANGGFFGSFAFVTMEAGRIKHLELIDSYYPDYIADTRIILPKWAQDIFGIRKMGFVAGNKFGFTDMDGNNLKTLYEKIFNEDYNQVRLDKFIAKDKHEILLHKYIKGVIFIRLDMMEDLIVDFNQKAWEWQFINASVDMIRGNDDLNKKEIYLQEVLNFFDEHKLNIIGNFISNLDQVLDEDSVNIYLSNVSTGLNNFLMSNNLSNVFESGNIYSWDTNNSFNKADAFVKKNIEIRDENNNILIASEQDIVDINALEPGNYTMSIYYSLNIPDHYFEFISDLEAKYDIELGDRERSILAVQPANYGWLEYEKWRESNSTMYFADNINVSRIYGDVSGQKKFKTDFGKGLKYNILINDNNETKVVKIEFESRLKNHLQLDSVFL